MSPEQVRPLVREYAHRGVNFLKYGSSGHGAWPDIRLQYIAFSTRVQHVIVEEGHNAGITVQAHTTSPESLDMAIEAGADIITHGDVSGLITEVPEETLHKLVQRHIPVSVIPVTQRYLDAELENPGEESAQGRSHMARVPKARPDQPDSYDQGRRDAASFHRWRTCQSRVGGRI